MTPACVKKAAAWTNANEYFLFMEAAQWRYGECSPDFVRSAYAEYEHGQVPTFVKRYVRSVLYPRFSADLYSTSEQSLSALPSS